MQTTQSTVQPASSPPGQGILSRATEWQQEGQHNTQVTGTAWQAPCIIKVRLAACNAGCMQSLMRDPKYM